MKRDKLSDADKPWADGPKTGRSTSGRLHIKNLFRIFCEGGNTEPLYLKGFPVNTETQGKVVGLRRSKSVRVRKVLSRLKRDSMLKGEENNDADRQIWVVFDMDCRGVDSDFTDFDLAVALALRHGLRVAWSNDAFELWFVLHYKYLDSALTRVQYYELLSGYLCHDYKSEGKRKGFCIGLYKRLLADQTVAIKNASKLFDSWDSGVPLSKSNPCTKVFYLENGLNRCLRP